MIKKLTRKKLADLYGIDVSTLRRYMRKIKGPLRRVATKIKYRDKVHTRNQLNHRQVKLIVKVMGFPPNGFKCINGHLIPVNED
jgi:hypothetical protein